MDGKKHVGSGGSSSSSSSSSLTMDLFGPKDLSANPSNVTSGLFGTVFPPASTVLARAKKTQRKGGCNNGTTNKDKNSAYQNQSVDQPCYFNSSAHYGGQDEVYAPQSSKPNPPDHQVYKKDGGKDDQNGNNSNHDASRGDWWQGSLYY